MLLEMIVTGEEEGLGVCGGIERCFAKMSISVAEELPMDSGYVVIDITLICFFCFD
jgi:hypothetical protein